MKLLRLWIGVWLGLVGNALQADIAPVAYTGGTLVPVEISDLRFVDAHVRIEWGAPCKLDAWFEIANDRPEEVALEIGFPVGKFDPVYGFQSGWLTFFGPNESLKP